jgi:hypothetical protein
MKHLKKFEFFIVENYSEIDKSDPFKILEGYDIVDETKKALFHGKDEYTVKLYKKGSDVVLCYALYSVEGNKVTVGAISSVVKGEGYGQILMIYLAKKYGYQNLIRFNLTESGKKMRQRLDLLFNFDYEKSKITNSKHIDKDILDKVSEKNPDIGMFLMMLVDFGDSEETIDRIESDYNQRNFEIKFSDIFELSTWIVDSKTNDNNPNVNTPNEIIDILNLLVLD